MEVVIDRDVTELDIRGTISSEERKQLERIARKYSYRGKFLGWRSTFKHENGIEERVNISYPFRAGDTSINYQQLDEDGNEFFFELEYGESKKASKLLRAINKRFGPIEDPSIVMFEKEYYALRQNHNKP